MNSYTKIEYRLKIFCKTQKTQPTENQKNNKKLLTKWCPVLTFNLTDGAILHSAPAPVSYATECVTLKSHESV